jgi:intermembrane space import and assembly protein 40
VRAAPKRRPAATKPASSPPPSDESTPSTSTPSKSDAVEQPAVPEKNGDFDAAPPVAESEGEQEETSAGAFNPETGEINWDCPCLGGMAHGPCGQQFREAFSCFVFSENEPKGIDCVEKFKAMQDCFREHPDVYGEGKSDVLLRVYVCLIVCGRNHG